MSCLPINQASDTGKSETCRVPTVAQHTVKWKIRKGISALVGAAQAAES